VHAAVMVVMPVFVVMFMLVFMLVIVLVFVVMFMVMVVTMFMVVMMLMFVQVGVGCVFFLAADLHRDVRAGNAAFHGRFPAHLHARDAERVQLREKGVGIGKQFREGRRQHIARRAHAAVKI